MGRAVLRAEEDRCATARLRPSHIGGAAARQNEPGELLKSLVPRNQVRDRLTKVLMIRDSDVDRVDTAGI